MTAAGWRSSAIPGAQGEFGVIYAGSTTSFWVEPRHQHHWRDHLNDPNPSRWSSTHSLRRSVAMLPVGAPALSREDALLVLEALADALRRSSA